LSLKDIKKEADELEVSFYEKHSIIDLDGKGGLMGTFTGDNAEEDAVKWLDMYRTARPDIEGEAC
jgi:hypothetical protein